MFILNFNVLFITNVLKTAPIRVRFSPQLLSEQDFQESTLLQRDLELRSSC
jgi:hypothetical protein